MKIRFWAGFLRQEANEVQSVSKLERWKRAGTAIAIRMHKQKDVVGKGILSVKHNALPPSCNDPLKHNTFSLTYSFKASFKCETEHRKASATTSN